MRTPLVEFLVSSPHGDVPVDQGRLHLPLECDPLKTPYGVYFQSIKDFLEKDEFEVLLAAVAKKRGIALRLADIQKIVVRTEKHGALYHPATVELRVDGSRIKLGLNVAVTGTGREWLRKEFTVLGTIHAKFHLPYLPGVYSIHDHGSMSFLLEDWFEGFHEFHLSLTEHGQQRIKLWEYGKGYRDLTSEQSHEIYRQASKILTLYYDINDFSQIFPWHHAAGDFIARVEDGGIDLRLSTARQYEPYMVFREEEGLNPVLALFFFLLNLCLKMRLDKLDGVGDTAWADDACLAPTLNGFREGLAAKDDLKHYFDSETEFFSLLKSFSAEDLKAAHHSLADLHAETADYRVIVAHLDRHVEALHATLQDFPL